MMCSMHTKGFFCVYVNWRKVDKVSKLKDVKWKGRTGNRKYEID